MLTQDEAPRIAANIAKLPANIWVFSHPELGEPWFT